MRFLRALVLDVVALGGFGAFIFGVHQVYPPAALIVGGLLAGTAATMYSRWNAQASTKREMQ